MSDPKAETTTSPAATSVGDAATVTAGHTTHGPHATTVSVPVAPQGYAIEGELGRGGMGVVYLARQHGLNRPVALKMVLSGEHADARELARFLAEAEAVAAVRHPHVVQVHEFGEYAGRPFMALEYCPGGSLAGAVRTRGAFPPREAAALVAKLARGVQAAHDLGIVHRDLKPGNVLLDAAGEPKVTDFGLAKRANQADLTRTGAVMGTPAYMAPEQAAGRAKFAGPGADVYALGVILFELLTGRVPFQGDDTVSVIVKVATQEPPTPRSVNPKVPRDTEVVCLKCLAKEPRRRYPTAAALADDLDRFLRGEPVEARPVSRVERAVKWGRRNPASAAAAGLGVLLALAVAAGSVFAVFHTRLRDAHEVAERERDEANRLRSLADEQRALAGRYLYASDMNLALRAWEEAQIPRMTELLDDHATGGSEQPGFEWHYLRRLGRADITRATEAAVPWGCAWSPDGRRLATGTAAGRIVVRDPETSSVLWESPVGTGTVWSVHFHPTDGRVAAASDDGAAYVFDADGRLVQTLKQGGAVYDVAFSPDGRWIATASSDTTLWLWDAATGERIRQFKGHRARALCLAFSPNGKRIVSGSEDTEIRVWDVGEAETEQVLKGHDAWVWSVAWSPDGTRVASAGWDHTARLWDPSAGGVAVAVCRGHAAPVYEVAFSPDGTTLASCSWDSTVRLWNAADGTETIRHRGHTNQATSLAWNPGGTRVATGAKDLTVRVWDATSGPDARVVYGQGNVVLAVFDPAGERLATISEAGAVVVRDAATGLQTRWAKSTFSSVSHGGFGSSGASSGPNIPRDVKLHSVAFLDGGRALAHSQTAGGVKVIDPATGKDLRTIPVPDGVGGVFHVSPDGRTIAAPAGADLHLFAVDGGTPPSVLRGHTDRINDVVFSPDGRSVVTVSSDRIAVVRAVGADSAPRTLAGHQDKVWGAAFSPDGKHVVTCSDDGTARLWEAETGRPVAELRGHTAGVYDATFSPDGTRIATGSVDRTVRVWDAATGKELLRLYGHQKAVNSVCFRPGGRCLVSAGADGQVRFWDAGDRPESPAARDARHDDWRYGRAVEAERVGRFFAARFFLRALLARSSGKLEEFLRSRLADVEFRMNPPGIAPPPRPK